LVESPGGYGIFFFNQIRDATQDEGLNVSVSDDGIGFDLARRRDGLGLRGLEERVKELDGDMTVTSATGQGTTITMHLPLPMSTTEVRLARAAG